MRACAFDFDYLLLCQVSELVGSIFLGLADIITDGIACSRLLHGKIEVPNEEYKMAYVTILCFGVVTTALSVAYRLRNAHMMRAHMFELGKADEAAKLSESQRHAQQHEFELSQTHRTKVVLSVGLLNVAAQGALPHISQAQELGPLPLRCCRCATRVRVLLAGLPMSIINCFLIFIYNVHDPMVRTFACFGGQQEPKQLQRVGRCLRRCWSLCC
jgi:hypothetical protein